MHSPSLSQRAPTAAVTFKRDSPPPQPNEKQKKFTTYKFSASPQFTITCLLHQQFYARHHQSQTHDQSNYLTALPPLFPNEWMKKLSYPIPGNKSRRAPTCYEPAQGTEQEGEATQNLGFYNNNNIFINDLQVYIVI